MNLKLFKIVIYLIMYLIIFNDAVMTLHCGLLLSGVNTGITEYIGGYSVVGFIILFVTSFLLKFCWLYRCILTHSFLVYTCIVFLRELGFGSYLEPLRWIMFGIGILLICLAIKKVYYGSVKNCWSVSD